MVSASSGSLSRRGALEDVIVRSSSAAIARVAEDLAARAGAQIVDEVEGVAARVENGGEAAAVAEPAEGVDQGQEGSDDDIAEHDMEQQLPVRPTSAVGAAPQVARADATSTISWNSAWARRISSLISTRFTDRLPEGDTDAGRSSSRRWCESRMAPSPPDPSAPMRALLLQA